MAALSLSRFGLFCLFLLASDIQASYGHEQAGSSSEMGPILAAVNTFKRPLVYLDASLADALAHGLLCSPQAAFVILRGSGRPSRRSAEVPFLTTTGGSLPLTPLINLAAQQLEAALSRPLFALQLQYTDMDQLLQQHCPEAGPAGAAPWVVFEAASGQLLVSQTARADHSMQQLPQQAGAVLEQLSRDMFLSLAELLAEAAPKGWAALSALLPAAAAAAATSGFAAAVPFWFCYLCPAVLGLLMPLAINFGLGAIATQVCERMKMDQEECFDLWVGALGVGFILSILSAIPIFQVCRLYECAHPSPSPSPGLHASHLSSAADGASGSIPRARQGRAQLLPYS